MTTAVNRPPTIGPEAELQHVKLLLATTQSVLDATQRQLEKVMEENFRLHGKLEALNNRP